jgi:hypothetical protein
MKGYPFCYGADSVYYFSPVMQDVKPRTIIILLKINSAIRINAYFYGKSLKKIKCSELCLLFQ